MPADLSRTDTCIFCGGADALFWPVHRLARDGRPRYAHPSCVAAELEADPRSIAARVAASRFGMWREVERADAAIRAARGNATGVGADESAPAWEAMSP